MNYLSVCSGIEAATVAWHPLGWQPVAFSEVERFPSAVLAHHYPHVPNWGDLTKFREWPDAAVDVLVGGTPCQSFSVAGLRAGMADPRGNLALTFLAVADRYRPRWVVWENVPGVLSSTSHDAPDPCPPPPPVDLGCDGAEVDTEDEYESEELHAFYCLVAGFSELGYFGAYWTPDAQYFRLAQRRRRVFFVLHLGDWRRAAAVLFERASLSGHPAPRREAGQGPAPTLAARTRGGGGLGTDFDCDGGLICADVAPCLEAGGNRTGGDRFPGTSADTAAGLIAFSAKDSGADAGDLAPTLRVGGFTNSHANGGVMPAVAYGIRSDAARSGEAKTPSPDAKGRVRLRDAGFNILENLAPTVDTGAAHTVAFDARQSDVIQYGDKTGPLDTCGFTMGIHVGMQVRRLTPRECERLQGFPDDLKSLTIRVCRTEDERRAIAQSVVLSSAVLNPEASRPVAVDVLIDLERQHLQLRSLGRSNWSASFADNPSSSPLRIPLADFAHVVAVTASTLAREIPTGAAESLLTTRHSSAPWNGSVSVHLCGREIEDRVADVGWSIPALSHSMKFITSEAGRSSQSCGAAWKTLCCSVAAAISSCIPDEIRASSSYDLKLTTVKGYTLIPYRGKPAADGPRYKALGNSMAVPVMSWIGRRIQLVEEIADEHLG